MNTFLPVDVNFPSVCSDWACARIDEDMQILTADTLAHSAGILEHDRVPLKLSQEYARHFAYCRCIGEIPVSPGERAQNYALFSLDEYHGFRYMFVEYGYTFTMYSALAVFFRSWKEYTLFCERTRNFAQRVQKQLQRYLEQLRIQPGQKPDGGTESESLMQSVMLLDRTLTANTSGEPIRCDLMKLLHQECQLTTNASFFDCRICLDCPNLAEARYIPLFPESLLLLIMTALFLLNDVSHDRQIVIRPELNTSVPRIILETGCERIPRFLRHTSDIQTLRMLLPRQHHMIHLAEYLCGLSGFCAEIRAGYAEDRLQIIFFYENDRTEIDFKSPAGTDRRVSDALSSARFYLYLLCTEQQKKNDDQIHRMVFFST